MRTNDSPATNDTPSKQRISGQRRREQILAVAARHFEDGPYSSVSTAAIADEAGVGRPLIHYYFKTKRDLYVEVVRRFAFVPPHIPAAVVQGIPPEALEDRIRSSIEYFLSAALRHKSMWTSTISIDAQDREIQSILEQADDVAASRMLEALGLEQHPQRHRLHVMILAFGGMARTAGRQWLVRNTMSRDEAAELLTSSLLTIIRDVVPKFD
ncbi:TetR/AcrR family transcriptional regulator [Mycobacteroides abscessus]|uniref:TetR/AcrR family transcriptional regulator n=1 Tax=Mycobacteroides abscessus TaxID=36809 RepID=UPI000D970D49|nr:TetR/AcrR family transcriptional regulator [Mycobacteroides abscessus]SPX87966.1 TetR family transcriptional regulator [Mycobacteroides abscessus]